eukprot:530978_1
MHEGPGNKPSLKSEMTTNSYNNLFLNNTFEDIQASKRLNSHRNKAQKNLCKLEKFGWKFISASHIKRVGFDPLPELPFLMTFMSNNNKLFYRTKSQILFNTNAFIKMSISMELPEERSDISDESDDISQYAIDDEGGYDPFGDDLLDDPLDEQNGYYHLNTKKQSINAININLMNLNSNNELKQTEGIVKANINYNESYQIIDYNPINCTLSTRVINSTLNYKNELIEQLKWKKK